MKTKKLIIILLIVQLLLSWASLSKDLDIADSKDIILGPLFIMGWSIFSGIFALLLNKNNIFDFVSKFSFFAISSCNILALLYISFAVLVNGPLRETGLIFIAFPIYGFFVFVGSIVLGVITFLVKKKLRKN
ncbi:hypothetical protein [Ostreibacterium oceani]|uniref:Uncharacterized protein n=1 Tax=Ostreibacterium oceani TaxID=2654998 RepID=A0A6N7EUB5_9GAMM|nr:hypothetical protein [Ostreibacterium oceani]MPV85120.1 hypothetical protein [Ostreibacterium oceani]